MRIINVMLGKGKGGIEQAFVDYAEALLLQKNEVLCISQDKAYINDKIENLKKIKKFKGKISTEFVNIQLGDIDIFAAKKIRQIVKKYKPDALICHGNRAIKIVYLAIKKKIPTIGITHNYSLKNINKCTHILTITNDLKNKVLEKGFDKNKVFVMNNMERIKKNNLKYKGKFSNPLVIGAYGRFADMKAFDILIRAVAALKQEGLKVKLMLGGSGPLEKELKDLTGKLNLKKEIKFLGWVKNKEKFFSAIDVFCVPSRHEPFGIVVLEGFLHKRVVVSANSEGPSEIIQNGNNGLLFEKDNPEDLAEKVMFLVKKPRISKELSQKGFKTLKEKYDINFLSKRLSNIIKNIIK